MSNFLSPEQQSCIFQMHAEGKSYRQIMRTVGCSKATVGRWLSTLSNESSSTPSVIDGPMCDYCHRKPVRENADFYRRTRRTSHKFCSAECYGLYRSSLKAQDCCNRCGVRRRSGPGTWSFTRGYCTRCYDILRTLGFDDTAADIYDLTINLKETIREHRNNG